MSIVKKVAVNTYYTRSINVERDLNSVDIVSSYIPTSRAVRTLTRVAEGFHDSVAPRAWSLIGPYGSGKSAFSLYLSHLLSNPKSANTQAAYQVLDENQSVLKHYRDLNKDSNGFLKVLISGAPEPLSKRLLHGLATAAQLYWQDLKGKKPSIIARLSHAAAQSSFNHSEIISLIKELQVALEKKANGIVIVIDELGKFLEYEARHYEANDIYLLQLLAEHACNGAKANLYLFALLHQSFEQYAKGLGDSLKKEWAKIQGRFEDIPFLEGTEQTLKVVAKAFSYDFDEDEKLKIKEKISEIVTLLHEEQALPGVMSIPEANRLFISCYPLHPVTALVLPYICQKIAQNERTLFSFLGSSEPFGLRNLLTKFNTVDEWVLPHHIFDYFITNQPAALGDHIMQRRWAEVMSAIDRLGDAAASRINFLKTVGLFNIIGAQSGLKASKNVLDSIYSNVGCIRDAQYLQEKAVLQYRKFNAEYRVWQGSDFDLEGAVQEELAALGKFSLATTLNSRNELTPIVARRYTIETGTLRYFTPLFIDVQTYKSVSEKSVKPRMIFFLATAKDDCELFYEKVTKYFGSLDILALCRNAPSLREATAEVEALNRVLINRQELNNDHVAFKEFSARFDAAQRLESSLVSGLLVTPDRLEWYCQTSRFSIENKRQLQVQLSKQLQAVYSKSPILKNELINRDQPSAAAVAARTKMLVAMLEKAKLKDLGFEKNPPEKTIYNSIVKAVGLHGAMPDGSLGIVEPMLTTADDKLNFRHVWLRVKLFIESTKDKARSFVELEQELTSPPFGLKAGILPIIYIGAVLAYKDSLAVYSQRRYKPQLKAEDIERFIKRPDEYTVQQFKIAGLNASIFSEYNQALYGLKGTKDSKGNERQVLSLAKPLAKFIEEELPVYTQQTRMLSKEAVALREAFKLSKSPLNLIFHDIPKALGFAELSATEENNSIVEGLAQKLTDVLRELKHAYKDLLKKESSMLATAMGIPAELGLAEIRKRIYGKIAGLENYTIDEAGVKAFIRRATNSIESDEKWLEGVLLFLGHKPTNKWTDKDRDIAEYRLNQFSRQVLDLQSLHMQYEKNNTVGGDFDVVLLKTVKKGQGEIDTVVTINSDMAASVADAKQDIKEYLAGIKDKEIQIAALAEVVNEYLISYKESSKRVPDESKATIKEA